MKHLAYDNFSEAQPTSFCLNNILFTVIHIYRAQYYLIQDLIKSFELI